MADEAVLRKFIKAFVKECGENIATAKILRAEGYLLIDAAQEYKVTINEGAAFSFRNKNLKEIHDELMYMIRDSETKNRQISYTKKEKSLVYEENGFKILLAEDFDRMKDIGKEMHICVGSLYLKPALNKECTILYLVNAEGRYEACIEVRKNRVCQIKSYCNAVLIDKPAVVVEHWIKNNNLNADCYDYQTMLEKITA